MAETFVTVEAVEVGDDGTSVVSLRLPSGLYPPLAPASLYEAEGRLLDLDAEVDADSGRARFRTRDRVPTEAVGRTYRLQQWWRPDQLDAVTDTQRSWVKATAPPAEHQEHCLLGWEAIEIPGGLEWGWRSGDEWLCDDCYRRFIVEDDLGLRARA